MSVYGQYIRTHIENFDNNTNNWIIAKNDAYHSQIKGGQFHIHSLSHQRTCFFSQAIPLLNEFDFRLTILMGGVVKELGSRFGFFWGQKSTKTYQAVIFSKLGVRFESRIKGYELLDNQWSDLSNSKSSNQLKKL